MTTGCPCINCPCVAICRLKMYMDMIRGCELLASYMFMFIETGYLPVAICRVTVMNALDPTEWRVDSKGEFNDYDG